MWIAKEPPAPASRSVMLLMDRSESMSLEEQDATRYQQALEFLRGRLLPALKSAATELRDASGESHHREVGVVNRLKEHHFIAGANQCENGRRQSFRRA